MDTILKMVSNGIEWYRMVSNGIAPRYHGYHGYHFGFGINGIVVSVQESKNNKPSNVAGCRAY